MKISSYSRNRILSTFATWDVAKDFADPIYNYMVYGFSPGSCFTSVLANDFAGAIGSSHPANTIEAFKALVGWMRDTMPREAYGSYDAVDHWLRYTGPARRTVLERNGLIYTAKQETMLLIKGDPDKEPVLY